MRLDPNTWYVFSTCLSELSHLTGAVVGQAGNSTQGGLPVTTPSLIHVTDEGAQLGVGRFPGGWGRERLTRTSIKLIYGSKGNGLKVRDYHSNNIVSLWWLGGVGGGVGGWRECSYLIMLLFHVIPAATTGCLSNTAAQRLQCSMICKREVNEMKECTAPNHSNTHRPKSLFIFLTQPRISLMYTHKANLVIQMCACVRPHTHTHLRARGEQSVI